MLIFNILGLFHNFLLQMYKKSEDTRKFLALFIIISVFIYMATCCDSSF